VYGDSYSRCTLILMRHTDMRLTMNVYTDPRIFDLAGAVAMLPNFDKPTERESLGGTGSPPQARRSESVSRASAGSGDCEAVIGDEGNGEQLAITRSTGRDLRVKNPVRQGRGKQAGEGGRTLDIHVGNVTLYH
jgi:hypothetical protein